MGRRLGKNDDDQSYNHIWQGDMLFLCCRLGVLHEDLMSKIFAKRITETSGEWSKRNKVKLRKRKELHFQFINKTNCIQPHQKKAKPKTWWIFKTPKSLKTIAALLNLSWFCSFLPHSQTLLQSRISAPRLPETCLWLLWYSTLNESCLVVIMGRHLVSPPSLTPSSGSTQNYIFFWDWSNQAHSSDSRFNQARLVQNTFLFSGVRIHLLFKRCVKLISATFWWSWWRMRLDLKVHEQWGRGLQSECEI